MKHKIIPVFLGLTVLALLTGCLNLQLGGGTTTKPQNATTGQQLIDLQQAKSVGAITDAEYQAQKAKILGQK